MADVGRSTDADSLHEANSDLEQNPSDGEADVEDDETSVQSNLSLKKRNKKKKRKVKEVNPSSGDSDSQAYSDDVHVPHTHKHGPQCTHGHNAHGNAEGGEQSTSGGDADAEMTDAARVIDSKDALQSPPLNMNKLQQIQKAMEMIGLQSGAGAPNAPKSIEEAQRKTYQFWDTQPVPKLSEEKIDCNEFIEADKPTSEIRQDPYSLPGGFHWDTLDINDPMVLKELYTLLNENYVEDDDNMFRFDYSPEFLQWALQPPGWLKDWHCGVRVVKSGKLIGFISAVPAHIKIYEKKQKMVEINFLCVHKKLRSKRVAPVLIREITRRVNMTGIFQAVYTAGVVLPKPVSTCRYWHRSLNPRKLIDVKFSHLTRNMTMQRTLKLYKLPEQPKHAGFRPCTAADAPEAYKVLAQYLNKFDLAPVFSEEEFRHWFIPRPGIVDSFVVEENGAITDFVSFYTLPSTVMRHPVHKSLKAAYSFYNASLKTPWVDLMQDALIVAKNMGFDVFNALDLMDNKDFLEKLKFGIGDGNLQYYLYNWRCPAMQPQQVGLVLQ